MAKRQRHSIQIPGAILDAIRDNEKFDVDDERFKKRKLNPSERLSRKERRKRERMLKKEKRSKNARAVDDEHSQISSLNRSPPKSHSKMKVSAFKEAKKIESEENSEGYDTMENPFDVDDDNIRYYAKKLGINPKKGLHKKDDYDSLGGLLEGLDFLDRYDGHESKDSNVSHQNILDQSMESEMESENYDNNNSSDQKGESDLNEDVAELQYDDNLKEYDDVAMDYYAKKLKIDPKKGLKKEFEGDELGGLLDGLNFDLRSNTIKGQSESEDIQNNSENYESEDEDEALELESTDNESDLQYSGEEKPKENPYVAPTSQDQNDENNGSGKYIPPALRKKMLSKNETESKEIIELKRAIKGPFNKLSEPTMGNCINDIVQIYSDHPRQLVNEAIVQIILEAVLVNTPLMESFLILYAAAIVAIYKLHGIDFGAYTIQTLVEKLSTSIQTESGDSTSKEQANLIGLIGFCYNFNLMSAGLIYDIISKKLLKNTDGMKVGILMKLIRTCGPKLRSDDTTALKQIIIQLNESVTLNESHGLKTSTRTKFLVETITNLKNNKLKSIESESTSAILIRTKKQLGRITGSSLAEPIKVDLDDIEHIKDRGKWWLVGSAWKGNDDAEKLQNSKDASRDSDLDVNDELGKEEINWLEVANQQRMNTDVRRAIFISIMSASDYMDAYVRLDKLGLKRTQKFEIPNILLHCNIMEVVFNPYYAFLAKKLCEDHTMRRTFKLNLWDLLKELDSGNDEGTGLLTDAVDDNERLSGILNLGKFYGFLIGTGSEPLNILHTVNFLDASSDVRLFMEILLITFINIVGKNSEIKAFGSGTVKSNVKVKEMKFSDKIIVSRLSKCKEQPLLLKGLRYFLQNNVKESNLIDGKRQRKRVDWGVDSICDNIEDVLRKELS